jgi:hypothetical protein
MMQGKRSPEDPVEWPSLSYAGNWDDDQVLTLMANSFQRTHHLEAEESAKSVTYPSQTVMNINKRTIHK